MRELRSHEELSRIPLQILGIDVRENAYAWADQLSSARLGLHIGRRPHALQQTSLCCCRDIACLCAHRLTWQLTLTTLTRHLVSRARVHLWYTRLPDPDTLCYRAKHKHHPPLKDLLHLVIRMPCVTMLWQAIYILWCTRLMLHNSGKESVCLMIHKTP